MLLYGYVLVSLGLGVMSNFVRAKWSVLASALVIFAGILINTWPYIEAAKYGVWQTVWRTLLQGIFWDVIPTALFFAVPFLAGRYGCQLLLKTVLRSARG